MKYRYFAALAVFLLPGRIALADEADWDARLQRAAALKTEAAQRQRAADAEFERRRLVCQAKFLVNDCINEARDEQLGVRQASRAQEREADEMERQVKREQLAARQAQATADAEEKARNLAQREQEIAARDQADAARRDEIVARKARQAEAGARRSAEREAAHRRKVEAHARKLAEAEARAAARAARQ
ncbi:hypothetical protein [Azonexus sp.]|uniref:hypothetical protein n=1 Tax=Azonexus sp. TaxID=1872668 RepID=UPI0035AFFEF8